MRLVESECFRVERLSLRGRDDWFLSEGDLRTAPSVTVVVGLDGCGVLERKGLDSVMFRRGDAVVVPAAMGEFSVRPQWEVEFLAMTIPPAEAANERSERA